LRRNQKRIAELNATIRKLEDRNTLLGDERNELVSCTQGFYFTFAVKRYVMQAHVMLEKGGIRGKGTNTKRTVQ
jgi:hypothetical protein